MRSLGFVRSVLAVVLAFTAVGAWAQAPAVVKFPGGPDVTQAAGNFVCPVNGTIRWTGNPVAKLVPGEKLYAPGLRDLQDEGEYRRCQPHAETAGPGEARDDPRW